MKSDSNPGISYTALFNYYHSDHLGSSSLLTDNDGNVSQHIEYLPFGEVFVEERNNNWNTPYKFNAKELDEETGLYYYGARYFDSRTSVWYGVDPLGEKYPGLSTYVYCANNPVKFIDPDGRDGVIAIKGNQINISANVSLYGTGATKAVASQMQKDINAKWGGTYTAATSDGKNSFDVSVNLNIDLYEGKEKNVPFIIPESWDPNNRDNFIEIGAGDKRSYVKGGDEGVWRSQGRNGMTLAQDDPAPHEAGHLLGLGDKYTDTKGTNKGWEKNIMGNSQKGNVEQKNINGILKDAIKAYEKWIKNSQNKGKEFKYEINTTNPNK